MLHRLRDLVLHNWNLKLASFAFALVLYSFVHGGQDARRSIVVDLEANLPREDANRVLQGSIPRSVRITVRGTNQAIDQLHAGNVNITVDLQSGRETHVNFDPRMVHGLPPGARLEVEQFDPAGIELSWEDRIVRSVPVQVAVVGTPAPGYVVKGVPVPEPNKVNVRGPLSEVSVLQFVRAAGFDVTGLSDGTYPRELALDGLSSRLRVEPRRVVVTTEITRELAERPFAKLPVAVVGLARPARRAGGTPGGNRVERSPGQRSSPGAGVVGRVPGARHAIQRRGALVARESSRSHLRRLGRQRAHRGRVFTARAHRGQGVCPRGHGHGLLARTFAL